MADHSNPEGTSALSALIHRIRMVPTNAATAARRAMDRLPGRSKAAIAGKPAAEGTTAEVEVQGSQPERPDNSAIAVRRMFTRARLVLFITVILAQVVIAVIGWRIKVWRAQRRRRAIEP